MEKYDKDTINYKEKAILLKKAIDNIDIEKEKGLLDKFFQLFEFFFCGMERKRDLSIIEITTSLTNKERILLRDLFKQEFNKDLILYLENRLDVGIDLGIDSTIGLSNNLKKTIIELYRTPEEFNSHQLNQAFKGILYDKNVISEVIATKTNQQLLDIKKTYQNIFNENLEDKISSQLSKGDYKKLLIELLNCSRVEDISETGNLNLDENSLEIDKDLIEADCISLYKAGEAKWGTDEDTFILIFSHRSSKHLIAMNKHYKNIYQKDLIQVIDSEFSLDIEFLLETIMQYHLDPYVYYAKRIYKACKGFGTDDSTLIRVLITVSNNYCMKKLDEVYIELYKMSLEYQITDETSGEYKEILLSLVKKDE